MYDAADNYKHLFEVRRFIQSKQPITREWVEQESVFIIGIRNHFENFTYIHPEVKNARFRRFCVETEDRLKKLMKQIVSENWFDVGLYGSMINFIIILCDIAYEQADEDDILSMLDGLSL